MSPSRRFRSLCRVSIGLCLLASAVSVAWHRTVSAAEVSGTPTCGNGLLEAGETCEACPADCQPAACKPTGKRRFAVALETGPGFETISTFTARIGFRSALLALPGKGGAPSVRARVHPLQPGTTVAVNDIGGAVRALATRRDGLPAGRVLEIEFDACAGAPRAGVGDLSCAVEACAWGGSPVAGCRCTIDAL